MPSKAAKFFEIEQAGKILVLIPRSNLTELVYQQVDVEAGEILKMLDKTPGTSVLIDCQNMNFFSSTTLGFFMKLWLRVRVREGRMGFCNLSDQEKEVLHLTKTDSLWSMSSSKSEALELLRG